MVSGQLATVIINVRRRFYRETSVLASIRYPSRQPLFLASAGIIHYRNERLQPESEP
jgi:hypothetical protein